jgi:hypothetical protein
VDGDTLVIGPSGEQNNKSTAYGMYAFSGLTGQHLLALQVSARPADLEMEYYVALADFTKLQWKWFGPVTLPEFQFNFENQDSRFISPLGNVYFVIATHQANVTTHNYSVLTYRAGGGDGGKDPGAPAGLVASDGDFADGVGLSWNPGDGAQWYEIYRAGGGNAGVPEWERLDVAQDTKYFDSSAMSGQIYGYKVRSVRADAAGQEHYSAFCDPDKGWRGGGDPGNGGPGVPQGLSASDGAYPGQIVVKWQPAGGDMFFELYRYMEESMQPGWTLVAQTKEPYYFDSEIQPELLYDYKVRAGAYDANGGITYSEFSNIDSGWAGLNNNGGDGRPEPPKLLQASDGAYPDQVVVKWQPGANNQWFELYRYMGQGTNPGWELIATTTEPYFYDASVVPKALYDYKVRAAAAMNDGTVAYSDFSNSDSGYASGGDGNGGGGNDPGK